VKEALDLTPTSNEYTRKYAMWGALFGLAFPIGSTLLQAAQTSHGISGAGIAEAQSMPLLWVIDTAPFFLGLFASLAGRRQDELTQAMGALEGSNTKLAEANEELIRASQLKSQFLANMSHELRTPLNAIIGFSRILIRKTEGQIAERQAKNLKMVHESGQHLLSLVNDILDIERIEAGMITVKNAEVDTREMASDVVAKLRPAAADRGLGLSASLPNTRVVMDTDPVRLRQILDNLVNNAIKYSDSGNIEVSMKVRPDEAKDKVLIQIKDEGIGIPQEQLPLIFDAFRQVDGSTTRAQGGVGLGLHLVKRMVQLLDGDVSVKSEVGKGSVFTVEFPTSKVVDEGALPKPDIDLAPMGEGPLLLIVDDSPEVIEIMRTELVDAGFRIHVALGGAEGLKKAAEVNPDAILLDIIMPEMDGWAVLKELRRDPKLSAIPVVITSMLNDVPKAYDLGIVAWLTKPVTPDAFKEVFARIGVKAQDDVLVVEDDPATSSMLMEHLSDLDIQGRAALDGKQAVEAFEDRLPRAVILDIMLPHLDGFQVLEHLRKMKNGTDVPVVVYTAKDLSDEERARLNGGITDIVGKGDESSANNVVEKIRKILDRAKQSAAAGAEA
jgi:signal transduction histidine kinase/CheY-like chemotaxis protein